MPRMCSILHHNPNPPLQVTRVSMSHLSPAPHRHVCLPASTLQDATASCQYWDQATSTWSSDGVLTLGYVPMQDRANHDNAGSCKYRRARSGTGVCVCVAAACRFEVVGGTRYLCCASTHLTAFMASTGSAVRRFSVNSVHPLDDAKTLPVSIVCLKQPRWLKYCVCSSFC
jgi:hypothetical protein